MKSLFFSIALLLSANVFSNYCHSFKQTKVSWVAFKTPAKAGVKGSLPAFSIKAKSNTGIKDILKSASINIDTTKVATGNKGRDGKIAKFFFSTMSGGKKIDAKVKKLTNKVMTLTITMNGVTKDVPMSYELKGKKFKAKGFIDVLDFGLSDELAAINKACKALHEGKTWADVEIHLESEFIDC